MADLKEVSSSKFFGGHQKIFSHTSVTCKCSMQFSIYIPPAAQGTMLKFPVLYNLAGLSATIQDPITESGFQRHAAHHRLVVVCPDVTPRNTGLPGENDDNRFYGNGAGFYMDAMTPGWKEHYNMFSYVTQELIEVIENNFAFVKPGRRSIMGHSMGGHGALLCTLKRPDLYLSTSCLAPASNASTADGLKDAYEKYLGTDKELWKHWDVSELVKSYQGPSLDFLIDFGTCDEFWGILKIWELVRATHGKTNINVDLKLRAGYDHNVGLEVTFFGYHFEYHANVLNQ